MEEQQLITRHTVDVETQQLIDNLNHYWKNNRPEFGPILQTLADKYYDEVTTKIFDGDEEANDITSPNKALEYAKQLFQWVFDLDDYKCVYHYVKIRN